MGKICPHCSSEFEPPKYNSLYCSRRCRRQFGNLKWKNEHPHPHEHHAWRDMRRRCNNPNHSDYRGYGARGIAVCDRWNSFENFIADMGPKPTKDHSIERIDNNAGYSPENCKWGTKAEQSQNRRPFSEWQYRADAKCANRPRSSCTPQDEAPGSR